MFPQLHTPNSFYWLIPNMHFKSNLPLYTAYMEGISVEGGLRALLQDEGGLLTLSTLPDNLGDSRFWTVSPGLQIRV